MKSKKAWVVGLATLVAVSLMLQVTPVGAQIYNPDEDLPKPTGLEKRLTKLGRGVSNVVLGWAELPVTFDRKLKAGKPLGYLVGVVPVLGLGRAVMRTGVGVYEIVSFPWSDEDVNFDAILEPEYIF